MTREEPLPQQETADADAPADAAAETLSDEMDSTEEAGAKAVADADVTPPARDEAAAVPPSAPAFPAPARETAAEQTLPADDVQTGDVRTDADEAPVSDAVQPEEAAKTLPRRPKTSPRPPHLRHRTSRPCRWRKRRKRARLPCRKPR